MQNTFRSVPFMDLARVYKRYANHIDRSVKETFTHGKVLQGPEVEQFEGRLANYCNRDYGVAVGSCTDALFFALLAAGIKPGDEVLVTGYSFIASASCIRRLGATPVFVDIEDQYFMMDLKDLEKKASARTKAIIAVHLFGQSLSIDVVEEFARRHNLVIIEDAAQSLGSCYKNKKVGQMGLASCVSFDPTKIMGAFGNGGIVLTDNEQFAKEVQKLRYHGKNFETEDFEILGYNSRLSSWQAGILNLQMDWLEEWIAKRQEIAESYNQGLHDLKEIQIPATKPEARHVFHKYVLKAVRRDELKKFLADKGIGTMIHYPKALYEYSLFSNNGNLFSKAETIDSIKSQVLSLPIYPELGKDEISFIIDNIRRFYS